MSDGSRPTVAQCSVSTSRLWAKSSGEMNGTFQPSASSATIRSVRCSPPPPTQIGSSGCSGSGRHRVVQGEVLALEVEAPSREQAADAAQRLLHDVQASVAPRGTAMP